MSRELKLRYSSLNFVSQQSKSQVKNMKNIIDKKDLKQLNAEELS